MDEYKHIRSFHTGPLLQITDWFTIVPGLEILAKKTAKSVQLDLNAPKTDLKNGALFISNHRDIVLDSGFLDLTLVNNGLSTVEIAIGDNLLIYPWIRTLVRLNRSFIVSRSGGIHDMLNNSRLLSGYIHYAVGEKQSSIWIAQREGRSKDSMDETQDSLLKMLTIAGEGSPKDKLRAINLTPLAISYEYDPCDYLKAAEMQLKRDNPDWHKSPEDDIRSMRTGIEGYKGRVVFHFTPSINPWLDEQHEALNAMTRQERLQAIAHRIDWQIHSHYEVFDRGTDFETYLQERLQQIDLPNKDEAFLMDRLREMYNNPVVNYEKSHLSGEF